MLQTHSLDDFRNRLHALRASLDDRAADMTPTGDDGGDPVINGPVDQGDFASRESAATVDIGLAESEASARKHIDDALERIDNGTFGICEECGGAIHPSRLDAVPYARHCVACATRLEQAERL